MAKPKFDPKDFLLKKGELIAMGISGFVLAVLLIWGATKWTSAKDPADTAEQLKKSAQNVHSKISDPSGTKQEDLERLQLPKWIVEPPSFRSAKVPEFTQTGQLFDPTAQPSTKRENPTVLAVGDYQVDLTRSAMLGYDIIFDSNGDALIAVLKKKVEAKYDADKVKEAVGKLADATRKGKGARDKLGAKGPAAVPAFPGGPMGIIPPGGPGAPMGIIPPGGPGAPMGIIPPGGPMGFMPGNPHGLTGGAFNQDAQRNELAITYIPLADLDKAVKDGNLPAFTVIPLRLVTVHAVVPYRKQLEEMKRALRLTSIDDAKAWGPWYDGFEVQRRVTKIMPNGQVLIIQDWPEKPADPKDTSGNYLFEEKYIERIDTRKIADHFEDGYIPYFLKPEFMLAMPLPALAKDLNVKYPDVKIKDITDNIDKLKKANQKELTQSELAKQVSGSKPRSDIYKQKTADAAGALGGYDPRQSGLVTGPAVPGTGVGPMPPMPAGPGGPRPGTGQPVYPEGYGPGIATTVNEVDNFLLRFVDCDVQPGYTYEYRIRLRMWNPNYNQKDLVANPEFAKESYKTLYSKWRDLATPITVPAESFLYARDVKAYRDDVNTAYPPDSKDAETKALNNLLQVKENQVVLEVATWMEQVRTDGGKREPVGAWVVAEMPVSRGEYVGKKQFIKLPLWSSETQQYLLREVTDKVVKGKYQPKGWLVDFSTRSVVVDFEGGRVKSRTKVAFDEKGQTMNRERTFEEDAATEVLIVRPDGKLVVRSSHGDDTDPNRTAIVKGWNEWVKEIEKRKTAGTTGDTNPFDAKK
jgi:hypothetical protein